MLSSNETRLLSEKYKGLEYLNLPVALADNAFSLLYFNSTFSKLFQQTTEVFPVRDFSELFENFKEKITILKQAGLALGHLQNFVIPSVRLRTLDRYFDLHVSKFNQELDHLEGFSVTCVEVTEREKEIQALQELSDHHLKYLKFTTSGVIIHQGGRIVFANTQANKMVGAAENETIAGREIWSFVTDEFKAVVTERLQRLIQDGRSVPPIEERFIRLDGSTFDAEVFAYPVKYQGKDAIKTIINDVSNRKSAEKKLSESQKKYAALVENLQDVIFQTDNDANFTFLNSAWQELTGYLTEETIGRSCFDFIQHPNNTVSFYQKVRKLISSGVQSMEHELLVKTKYNEWKYVDVKLQTVYADNNTIKGISGVIIDIHAKKLAQLELKKIEENLKLQNKVLLSLAKNDAIYHGDFDNALQDIAKISADTLQVSRVNIWQFENEFAKLTGLVNYSSEIKKFTACMSFRREEFPEYFHSLIQDRVISVSDVMKDHRVWELREIYFVPSDIVSTLNITIMLEDRIWGVICFEYKGNRHNWTIEDQGFARSIADFISLALEANLKKKEKLESAKRNELYRTLIEQANDAILIVGADDRVIEVNKSACALSGYERDEFIGMDVIKLFPQRFIREGVSVLDDVRKVDHFIKERIFVKKNGQEVLTEISAVSLPDGRIQGIIRDVTERREQEKALQESETRLELALKGAELGTWDFFIQEDKLIHNKTWGELLGYSFEMNVVNEHFMDKFVHPDDVSIAYEEFEKHLRGETQVYEVTIRMLASNGEWRWIQDKGRIVEWDAAGSPLRASGIHQDVTALKMYEKEIQLQKKYLQQIINAIPNLIYVKNVSDEFVMVNNALSEFLGVDQKLLLQYQSTQKDTVSHKLTSLFKKDAEVFISRKPLLVLEQQIYDEDKKAMRWLQSIKVPLTDTEGNYNEILSVSTDITDLKLKEQELADLNDKLELRASERTLMLEAANKELETFNYSVSHDLRTPLRTIDIFAYFLEKNYRDKLDKEGSDNILQIRQSIMKMSALIDNLLIFSKMGRLDIRLSELQTEELIREVINEISREEDTQNIQFTIASMPLLYADYGMMKQAMHNLVSNAVKFTKTKRRPIIEFFGVRDEENITLAVRDNGVGFSMEYKDKLFKAFKRLHSEEYFEGTGVGLAIVEKIIKRHNGQVWAESEENKGTTFFIKLPVKKPAD